MPRDPWTCKSVPGFKFQSKPFFTLCFKQSQSTLKNNIRDRNSPLPPPSPTNFIFIRKHITLTNVSFFYYFFLIENLSYFPFFFFLKFSPLFFLFKKLDFCGKGNTGRIFRFLGCLGCSWCYNE